MKIFKQKIQLLALAICMAALFTLSSCEKEQLLNEVDTNTESSEVLNDSRDDSNQRFCNIHINNGIYQYIPNNSAVSSGFGVCNNGTSGNITTNNNWISISTYSNASYVYYSLSQNNGPQRYGCINVGCRSVTIHQKGAVGSMQPSPPPYNPTCYNN